MMQSFSSYSWWSSSTLMGLGVVAIILISILALAIIALKGYALWHAAKRDEMWWFIALLLLNTMGILELIYLIFVAKKWNITGKSANMGANDSGNDNSHNSRP